MTYPKDFVLGRIYRDLYRIRNFEKRCVRLYRQGKIRGYLHPYLGEEAIAVGVCAALRRDDYIVSTHRGHGHCLAKGAEIKYMMAEICGRRDGYCGGYGGSMHIADPTTGNLGANGIVGGGIPIGVGAALGIKIRSTDQVAAVFFSDGAANNGVFAESLNLAAIWSLPLIFVLENNHYAVSTPVEESSRTADLHLRAEGYKVSARAVDGNDVLAVHEQTLKAAEACRSGSGPVLIEAKTYRHGGHHVNDHGAYMPRERLEHYLKKDPVDCFRRDLLEKFQCQEDEVKSIEAEVDREIADAVDFADKSPAPAVAEFLGAPEFI